MKKLSIILSIVLMSFSAMSQTQPVKQPVSTKDTVIKNVSYKLFVGARGGKYILVTSKAGNVYKKYLK